MNYMVFEQAAVEASAGLQEVDAELEHLMARRQALESKRELLDTLVNQLLLVLPGTNQECSPEALDNAAALPDGHASKLFPVFSGGQDSKLKDEWSAFVQRSAPGVQGPQ